MCVLWLVNLEFMGCDGGLKINNVRMIDVVEGCLVRFHPDFVISLIVAAKFQVVVKQLDLPLTTLVVA